MNDDKPKLVNLGDIAKTDFPTAPPQTTGPMVDPNWRDKLEHKPVDNVAPLNVYFSDVDMSDVRRAIDNIRTKQDLLAVIEGKETLHLITGDVKKMGVWSLIVLLVKIISKFL